MKEAIVIGGGPAGCALAILLARSGRDVTLLEKENEVTHKVCGEFLSWEACYYLEKLGLDLLKMGAQKISHVRLIQGKNIIQTALPCIAWSISRCALDKALQDKAKEEGVSVLRRFNVIALSNDKFWTLEVTNQKSLKAHTVFLANGKHELRGWGRKKDKEINLIGLKMHYRVNPQALENLKNTVEIMLFKGGYAGIEPVENDVVNLCLLIEKQTFLNCGKNWDGVFEWLKSQSSYFSKNFIDALPEWEKPLAIYNIPYGYIYQEEIKCPPNLYRLGDQMAVIHSLAGDGIAMALHSSFKAAESYLSDKGSSDYHQNAYKDMKRSVQNAQYLSKIALSPVIGKMAFPVLKLFPNVIQKFFLATRVKI